MVVTGLTLLFGGRADPGRVRAAGRAGVEGRLVLPPESPAWERAADAGADPDDDGSLILARTVSAEGRSRAFLGGRSVPVGVVAELAEGLLAVHGQSDQLRLSRPAEQRRALDRYAGPAHLELLDRYRAAHQRWRELTADLERRRSQARELAQAADVLRHGLEEIEAVAPEPGEDDALDTQAKRLGDADALRAAADEARAVAGRRRHRRPRRRRAAAGRHRRAVHRRSGRSPAPTTPRWSCSPRTSPTPSPWCPTSPRSWPATSPTSTPTRAAWPRCSTGARSITALVRKYAEPGEGLAGVLAWAEDAAHKLAALDVSDEALEALAAAATPRARRSTSSPRQVSAGRRAAADGFAAEVGRRARRAGDEERARSPSPSTATPTSPGADGIDEVALLLAAHPGAPPRPVHKGASGGELSRVMLAIEVVFAGADPVPVMVFDEVDAGVGGQAAGEIGRRLARLARDAPGRRRHPPGAGRRVRRHPHRRRQVARTPAPGVTATDIRAVDGEDRVRELARMLSGLADSDTGQAHARELLAVAADARG